jgi:uncharacterized protein (TIGR02453 family)
MAYDALLAQRLRNALAQRSDVAEKPMFGGLCFLAGGHMLGGIVGDELMLRVGPDRYAAALAQPHAREMDFTGRPLRGMVYVAPPGFATDAALQGWLRRALAFADGHPPKPPKYGKARKPSTKAKVQPRVKAPSEARFTDFAKDAFTFLRGIAQHNTKAWFQAHQAEYHALYDTAVRFAAAVGPKLKQVSPRLRFDPRINGSVFRIQRDIRFSKDKTPYKPHLDLWFWAGDRKGWDVPGCFFRMFAKRLLLGAGMHGFEKDQLERYRRAVVAPRSGKALATLVARLEKAGYALAEPTRKHVPRGFDPSHPRAALLLLEGLHATYEGPVPREVSSAKFVDFCLKRFRATWPVNDWLLRHVVK